MYRAVEISQQYLSVCPAVVHQFIFNCKLKHILSIYLNYNMELINLYLFSSQSIKNSQNSLLTGERNLYVNEHFTRTLHQSICRALFVKDRHLFTVLLAFAALRSKVIKHFQRYDGDEKTCSYYLPSCIFKFKIILLKMSRVPYNKKQSTDCMRKLDYQ